jgi:hypothetical protein
MKEIEGQPSLPDSFDQVNYVADIISYELLCSANFGWSTFYCPWVGRLLGRRFDFRTTYVARIVQQAGD